jgi:hypothetical protein
MNVEKLRLDDCEERRGHGIRRKRDAENEETSTETWRRTCMQTIKRRGTAKRRRARKREEDVPHDVAEKTRRR